MSSKFDKCLCPHNTSHKRVSQSLFLHNKGRSKEKVYNSTNIRQIIRFDPTKRTK